MIGFGSAQWIFSIKLFTAAMVAYALSVRMALPQSYWAVVTCCVVMNPTTGAIRSKAICRFAGTCCGGITALLLCGVFVSAPVLLIACAGLLATLGFGWALLDRTPRSYGFQLYSVTLLLVAVAGVDHPENMFDTASARICEIAVGIACATVIDSIFVPGSLAPAMHGRLRSWLADMGAWMNDALVSERGDASSKYDRHRIIADLTAMSALAGQLRYDPMVSEWERRSLFAIQRRLLRMVPMLSSIESYSANHPAGQLDALTVWKHEIAQRAKTGHVADSALIEQGRNAFSEEALASQPWNRLLQNNFIELVSDVLQLWSEVRSIYMSLESRIPLEPGLADKVWKTSAFPLWPDFDVALRVSAGILLSYAVLCVLWWATGWSQGPNAVLMGTVALAFFGSADEAGKAIGTFLKFNFMALLMGGVLSYGLLPFAQDFPSFVVVMGLVMLPLGVWAASNPLAILLLAMGLSNINLQAVYTPLDFGSFLDAVSGTLIGIHIGSLCIHLVRRMGASHTAERLRRQERQDIAALTRQASPRSLDDYSNRSLDRIASITSRRPVQDDQSTGLLSWLRAGMAIGIIRQACADLTGELRDASESMLTEARLELVGGGSKTLLKCIDDVLSAACNADHRVPHSLIRGLVGLRLALFEQSPPWRPVE